MKRLFPLHRTAALLVAMLSVISFADDQDKTVSYDINELADSTFFMAPLPFVGDDSVSFGLSVKPFIANGRLVSSISLDDIYLYEVYKRFGLYIYVPHSAQDQKYASEVFTGEVTPVSFFLFEVFTSGYLNGYFKESGDVTEFFRAVLPSLHNSTKVFYIQEKEIFYSISTKNDLLIIRAFFELTNFAEYKSIRKIHVDHSRGGVTSIFDQVQKYSGKGVVMFDQTETSQIPVTVNKIELGEFADNLADVYRIQVDYSYVKSGSLIVLSFSDMRKDVLPKYIVPSSISNGREFLSEYLRDVGGAKKENSDLIEFRVNEYEKGVIQGIALLDRYAWSFISAKDGKEFLEKTGSLSKLSGNKLLTDPESAP